MEGETLGAEARDLAIDAAQHYLAGDLVVVAGAGVSRASGLPGWAEMIESLQGSVAHELQPALTEAELDQVLTTLHDRDPISRADSLQRLVKQEKFRLFLHTALYAGLKEGMYRPSIAHWHIASLTDRDKMPEVFTSNYDDLLEVAKQALGRSGRIRHFHGRLTQRWSGAPRMSDPPVVTSRDYYAAEEHERYEKLAQVLSNKSALLVGFSLADPNLTRVIRKHSRDTRAVLVATRRGLSETQQRLRLNLLRRYWRGLKVDVTAIERHDELPALLLAIRREVDRMQVRSPSAVAAGAFAASVRFDPASWDGAREWRIALQDAVRAAKQVPSVGSDGSLRAGLYVIQDDGYLEHSVSSATKRDHMNWPRRRLLANDPKPWGAAGYAYAAGVSVASSSTGEAFDRNVPEAELLRWQQERSAQRRLPAASVICVPVWVRYAGKLEPVGVAYFSSRRAGAFDDRSDRGKLGAILELAFEGMMEAEHAFGGTSA